MILRTKVRIRRHQFRIAAARHPGTVALQTFAVIPALLVGGLLLFLGIGGVLSRVEDQHDASAMLATLLTLTAVAAFIGSSTTALQSLYLSNDLPFLMTLPVPLRVLYGSKLVESLAGAVPAACFGFVVLAAYGASRAESVLFFPAAILAEALVVAMATTVAVIVVALVTRWIPARRARLFLFGISLTIVGSTVLVWNAVAPSQQDLQLGGGDRSMAAVGESLDWLPTAWLARAVAAASAGDPHGALSAGAGAAAATLVAVITSYQIFSRSFAKSVAMARATAAPRSSQILARRLSALVRLLPQDIGALVVKEWLTLLRDLKRLSGVIWPLGVVAVYAVISSREHPVADDGALRFWQANAAVALVPWAISLGLSIYAFGSEQRAINLLRLLPFGPRRLFAGKVLAALVPVTLLSEVIALAVVLAAGGGWREVGGMMVLVAWGSVGFVTIDTAAAAFAPNFEADHIQRSTELVGRAFGMVAGAAFGILSAVAVGRVVIFAAGTPPALQQALGWQVAGLNPLGWPLIIGAVVGALTILIVVVRIAFDRIRDLILNGP